MSYNIEMNINENGNYTPLYPKVDLSNVISNTLKTQMKFEWSSYIPETSGFTKVGFNKKNVIMAMLPMTTNSNWNMCLVFWKGSIIFDGNTIQTNGENPCYATDGIFLSTAYFSGYTGLVIQHYAKHFNTTGVQYDVGYYYLQNE